MTWWSFIHHLTGRGLLRTLWIQAQGHPIDRIARVWGLATGALLGLGVGSSSRPDQPVPPGCRDGRVTGSRGEPPGPDGPPEGPGWAQPSYRCLRGHAFEATPSTEPAGSTSTAGDHLGPQSIGDLLHGPAVAVRVAEVDEAAPGELLDLADVHSPLLQLVVGRLGVRDDDLESRDGAGRRVGEALAQRDGAGRAAGRELAEAEMLPAGPTDVGVEAPLLGEERLSGFAAVRARRVRRGREARQPPVSPTAE